MAQWKSEGGTERTGQSKRSTHGQHEARERLKKKRPGDCGFHPPGGVHALLQVADDGPQLAAAVLLPAFDMLGGPTVSLCIERRGEQGFFGEGERKAATARAAGTTMAQSNRAREGREQEARGAPVLRSKVGMVTSRTMLLLMSDFAAMTCSRKQMTEMR